MNFKVVVKRTMKKCTDVPEDFFFKFVYPITDNQSFIEFCYLLALAIQDGECIEDISILEE